MPSFGDTVTNDHARWQPWDQIQGWLFRNGSIKDKVLVANARGRAIYRDGKVYVATRDIAIRVDKGLMIRE